MYSVSVYVNRGEGLEISPISGIYSEDSMKEKMPYFLRVKDMVSVCIDPAN